MAKRVLIDDDDHDTHVFIADLLEMYGYKADCVHSTDVAQEVIHRERPDFLILDLHIERPYAGWLLLQQLRTDPATAEIPAVLATSDQEFVRTHKRAVQALRGDVLEKPFAMEKLVEVVKEKVKPE